MLPFRVQFGRRAASRFHRYCVPPGHLIAQPGRYFAAPGQSAKACNNAAPAVFFLESRFCDFDGVTHNLHRAADDCSAWRPRGRGARSYPHPHGRGPQPVAEVRAAYEPAAEVDAGAEGRGPRRRAQGATLAELARSYGVGKSTISRPTASGASQTSRDDLSHAGRQRARKP